MDLLCSRLCIRSYIDMKLYKNKKEALELLDIMKAGYEEVNINVQYNKKASLDELNAIIEFNFKKFAKYVMKIKGVPYDKGGIH